MFGLSFTEFSRIVRTPSVLSPSKPVEKRPRSNTKLIHFFNALIHMLTAAGINDEKEIQESDYIYTIRIFVIITAITTVSALLSLGMELYLFNLVMDALKFADMPMFYITISVFLLGNVLSNFFELLAHCASSYARNVLTMIFQLYMDEKLIKNSNKVDLAKHQRAFVESIEVACAHIPAMIKISAIVLGYGLYAVYNFNPVLLAASSLVGILVQFINRGATKCLSEADTQEKKLTQETLQARSWIYENSYQHDLINSWPSHLKTMRNNTAALYRAKMALAVRKAGQKFLAKLVKLLSNAFYYVYFSSAVFLGYMTLGEMFVLLPFIDAIGRSAAQLVALPMMIGPTKSCADNLIEVWNAMVEERLRVRDDLTLTSISSYDMMSYMVRILLGLWLMQWALALPSLKLVNTVVVLLSMNAVVRPKSPPAQLWVYFIRVLTHSSKAIGKGKLITPPARQRAAGATSVCVAGKTYGFDPKILAGDQGNAIQIRGPLGVGKTAAFSMCAGKLRYNGQLMPGYYSASRTMVLTPTPAVYPVSEQSYIHCLAETFNIPKGELCAYIDQALFEIEKNDIEYNKEKDKLSTGAQQLLFVLTGICKSVRKCHILVVIDEALNSISADIIDRVYAFAKKECAGKCKLAVVHHNYEIEGYTQVVPDVSSDTTNFVLEHVTNTHLCT